MRSRAPDAQGALRVLGATIVVASLTACGDVAIEPDPTPVAGTGDVGTESRDLGDIERISIAGPIEVVIRTGEPGSVTLSGQANLLPLVQTENRDGQLIVAVRQPGFTSTEPVTLTVVSPAISSVAVSGGARGTLEVVGEALRLDLSGAARMDGTGRLDTLDLVASSDARLDLSQLVTGDASISMSGGAAATLAVENRLSGTATGGATITLAGQPATVDVTVESGASVQGEASPAP
jgi:hypothetical protein